MDENILSLTKQALNNSLVSIDVISNHSENAEVSAATILLGGEIANMHFADALKSGHIKVGE